MNFFMQFTSSLDLLKCFFYLLNSHKIVLKQVFLPIKRFLVSFPTKSGVQAAGPVCR